MNIKPQDVLPGMLIRRFGNPYLAISFQGHIEFQPVWRRVRPAFLTNITPVSEVYFTNTVGVSWNTTDVTRIA